MSICLPRQRHIDHALRTLRALCLISGVLGVSTLGRALDSAAAPGVASDLSPIGLSSPIYLEKSTSAHSLTPEAGWQVGGFNTQFQSQRGNSSLSLQGGVFASRTLAAQRVLDNNVPIPGSALDLDSFQPSSRAAGLPAGLAFSVPSHSKQRPADDITYQRMEFQTGRLRVSGAFADVDANCQGVDALVKRLAPTDAQAASLLSTGMRHTQMAAEFAGPGGVKWRSAMANIENSQQGHKERGLVRETQTHSLSWAGSRFGAEWSTATLDEAWDAAVARKDAKRSRSQTMKLSSTLARKSSLSLAQTTTDLLVGMNETSQRQIDVGLKWQEWSALGLQGNYTTKTIEQTGEMSNSWRVEMRSKLAGTQLSGKIGRSFTTATRTAAPVAKDELDLKLETRLSSALQWSSQLQETPDAQQGATQTTTHQLSAALSPRWKMLTQHQVNESATLGEAARTDWRLTGQVGTTTHPAELSFTTRQEALADEQNQERAEVKFQQTLVPGKVPTMFTMQAGNYALEAGELDREEAMLTAQVLQAPLTSNTTVSFGYFSGPSLGTAYLNYRAWGLKPTGNLERWRPADFSSYQEVGGEMRMALSDATKVVVKEYNSQQHTREDQTLEYGFEHTMRDLNILGGRRYTSSTTTEMPLEESWWRLVYSVGAPMPDWVKTALRTSIFTDGAKWGFGQLPTWVPTPKSGLQVDRQNVMVGGKAQDKYAVQFSGTLGSEVYVQSGYERHPAVINAPNQVDPVRRGFVHLGVRIRPRMHVFGRYHNEMREDKVSSARVHTCGLMSQMSTTDRVQVQVDALTRITGAEELTGTAVMLEYERLLAPDDQLSVKYRLNPESLYKADERVRLDVSYQHAF